MRILFLTNLYPPVGNGGYEQWCQEVAERLIANGHTICILTSRTGSRRIEKSEPEWLHRELHMEMEFASLVHGIHFFTQREAHEQENLACLRKLIGEFLPDLVLVWGMWNLHRSLAALAERLLPGRVVYYMGDYWPTLPSQHEFYWQAPAQSWITHLPKSLLKPLASRLLALDEIPSLGFERVLFPSLFLRDEFTRLGIVMGETRVIYGAVDTRAFAKSNGFISQAQEKQYLSLLYAGRLAPEKGVQTAIEAMRELVCKRGLRDVKLTIAGGGERGFENHLHGLVRQFDLEAYVNFLGRVPKEAMTDLYRHFDVFLFTSTWKEPFGRVLVEALASGIVVVGTATGGAAEILIENVSGLTFPPGDSAGLSAQIVRLHQQPSLREQLVETGRRIALEKFDISRMSAEIENYLQSFLTTDGYSH